MEELLIMRNIGTEWQYEQLEQVDTIKIQHELVTIDSTEYYEQQTTEVESIFVAPIVEVLSDQVVDALRITIMVLKDLLQELD